MSDKRSLDRQPVVLESWIKMEFRSVSFCREKGGGGGGWVGRANKTLTSRMKTNNKLNPHMMPGVEFKLGLHWWDASGLTTAPSLLPL